MTRLFVTNRPNYCHKRFAETAGCTFYYAKHFIPENIPVLSLPFNGVLNSLRLPDADIYFAESIMDYYPVYYKNTKSKKLILLAEDTLFKLEKLPNFKRNYILKLFRSADGFIAISDLCKVMMLRYVKRPVRVAYPFPHKEFFHVKSDINTKNVLFIGRDDKTKGFVELVEAIKLLRRTDKEWILYLIGDCSTSVRGEEGINPMGFVKNMEPYFKKCSFLVHPAHFDPCPATIFEAMNAGMITLISNSIGQAGLFRKNGLGNLILKYNSPKTIAEALKRLSEKNNKKISSKLRSFSKDFTEKKRLKIFGKEFESLAKEI